MRASIHFSPASTSTRSEQDTTVLLTTPFTTPYEFFVIINEQVSYITH